MLAILTRFAADVMSPLCLTSRANQEAVILQALCELPESYEAYRKQQHRWHSGPMQLFRLCLPDIIASKVESISLLPQLLRVSLPLCC